MWRGRLYHLGVDPMTIDWEATDEARREPYPRDWATELDPAYQPDGDRTRADQGVERREVKEHAR